MLEQLTKELTCGAMTKIAMKVKRIKLIHTKERKNKKKEPIPAPKCPDEKKTEIYTSSEQTIILMIQIIESIIESISFSF